MNLQTVLEYSTNCIRDGVLWQLEVELYVTLFKQISKTMIGRGSRGSERGQRTTN